MNAYCKWLCKLLVLAGLVGISKEGGVCEGRCECYVAHRKQTADCRESNFIRIPSTLYEDTQVLHMEGNNIATLFNNSFIDAKVLEVAHVFLADNMMLEVQPGAFRGLDRLVEVDLSNNNLKRLHPLSFIANKRLTILSLKINLELELQEDVPILYGVPYLSKLDLSQCKLRNIPKSAFRNLTLRDLNLKGNQLRSFSVASVEIMTDLLELDLSSNPWYCDCELKKLRDWYFEFGLDSPQIPKCASPEKFANKPWTEFHVCESKIEFNVKEMLPGQSSGTDESNWWRAHANDNETLQLLLFNILLFFLLSVVLVLIWKFRTNIRIFCSRLLCKNMFR